MVKHISSILVLICFALAFSIPLINTHQEKVEIVARAKEIDAYFTKTEDTIKNEKYAYIAILEIPSISLKYGIVSKDNPYNDIKYNIQVLKESTMPDIPRGNLILAAHNGNSNVSYFKNLESMKTNDEVIVYYNDHEYIYEIASSYITKKDGTLNITRDISRNTITLITCKNNSDTEQIVFIGYLKDII